MKKFINSYIKKESISRKSEKSDEVENSSKIEKKTELKETKTAQNTKRDITEKKKLKAEKDLFDTDKVYLFMNMPTKGGIIEHINNLAKFYKSIGKEVYFISEGYKQVPDYELFNLENLEVDHIYNMGDCQKFNDIIKDGSLLIFTQARIAKSFVNYFKKNKVIVQYHRNIDDITESVLKDLYFLENALVEGEIQFLEPQELIEKKTEFKEAREFKNYIFPPNKPNTAPVKKVKNIGYISRLTNKDKAKNIDGVLRIIRKTIELNPEIIFHIYGEGDKKADFEELGNNVLVHGFVYDKDEIYKDLDLVILPSVSEAYPMVLVEAISYGTKVISYENTSMINSIISPKVGKVIPINEEDTFASAIAMFEPYNREEALDYAKETFFFNKETMCSYMSPIKAPTYKKNKAVYFYDCSITDGLLKLDFFSGGYFLETAAVLVGSTIPYNRYDCKSDAPDIYSEIAYNYRKQFFTIEININDIKEFDYIKLYKNMQVATITITKSGCDKIPLGNGEFLVLQGNEFTLERTTKAKIKNQDIFNHSELKTDKERVLLFQDRLTKAHDNGEALYKYAVNSGKYNKENLYFVINENAHDYYRLLEEGAKVIYRGSNKHKYLFLTADAVCSSHIKRQILIPFGGNNFKFYKKSKTVFLQHGIIFSESDYKYFLNTLANPVDMMVTSTSTEKALVEKITNYQNIVLTGLARYDLLKQETDKKSTIFYFPTWNRALDLNDFESSVYFKKVTEFLYSKKLEKYLTLRNIKINFLLHPELDQYIKLFKNTSSVKVLNPEKIEFSKVLSNASMLITDASSIAWDVSYQDKPVLVYAPYETHSSYEGTPMEQMGTIVTDVDEAINEIINSVENNFIISKEQKNAIDNFYAFKDRENSKRIMAEIEKILV